MIDSDTVESAKQWVHTGVQWMETGAFSMGVKHLEKAIPVFAEAEDTRWLTYTRHQKLVGLDGMGRHEEAEGCFEEVMIGYVDLDDPYGKTLVLFHTAQAMDALGRWERAISLLNLASSIAQWSGRQDLHAHILTQLAKLYLGHDNLVEAVRLLQKGENLYDQAGQEDDALQSRLTLAEALVRLGERSEAIAKLEDAQTRLFKAKRYRQALEPLRQLITLYEEGGMWNDKSRISQLIHFCGQYILQNRDARVAHPETRFKVSLFGEPEDQTPHPEGRNPEKPMKTKWKGP
ncbi:MAG: hypothetical protein OEW12_06200 [Deltaproteobacteria bacterium]|nr:hypothetical protein [Deltaproteobacteria bacterium]